MHLRDATDTTAVELFLRTLAFPFPARDLVGIPGGFVGLEQPIEEEDLVLLIHEFEHLTALTYPIGMFFTALGLRVHDLRNDISRRGLQLRGEREIDGESTAVLDLALVCAQTAEFARLILTTVELFTPLLEGLALLSEMELDYRGRKDLSLACMSALGLEAHYHAHRTAIMDRNLLPHVVSEQFVEQLIEKLEDQIERARDLRRAGDLIDAVFWPQDSVRANEAFPYFAGYLFLRRLYQEWRREMDTLELEDFTNLASRLVCSVFPLSLLSVYSFEDRPGRAMSEYLPSLFCELLEGALSLSQSDLVLLRDSRLLLSWDWKERRLRALPEQNVAEKIEDVAQNERRLVSEFIWSIFDCRSPDDSRLRELAEALELLEDCKFLTPTAARPVMVAAVDDKLKAALLVDLSRMVEQTAGSSHAIPIEAATYFLFRQDEFVEFLALMESENYTLPRVQLGNAPYIVKRLRKKDVKALLVTVCHFWPEGVADEVDGKLIYGTKNPIAFVRRLACEGERVFREQSEQDDFGVVLALRGKAESLLKGIRLALQQDYEEPRKILLFLEKMINPESLGCTMVRVALDQYCPGLHSRLQANCRAIYDRVLFPKLESGVAQDFHDRKLRFLGERLDPSLSRILRRWLHAGLVLDRRGSCRSETGEPMEAAVASIANEARAILGIPLVTYKDGQVLLDLLPAPV